MQWISSNAIELLTGVLVVITGVYAWLTFKVVDEARKTREQQLRPHLKLHIKPAGAGIVFPTVMSMGPGGAVNLDATITAGHRDGEGETVVRLVRQYVAPHEATELLIPDPTGKQKALVRYTEIAEAFSYLRLHATMEDVLGNAHTISDAIDDLDGWFAKWGATWTRATPDHDKNAADALKSIDQTLKKHLG